MDESRNTNAKGHSTGNISTHLYTYHTIKAEYHTDFFFSVLHILYFFSPKCVKTLWTTSTTTRLLQDMALLLLPFTTAARTL